MPNDRPDPADSPKRSAQPAVSRPAATKSQPTNDATGTAQSATPASTPVNPNPSTASAVAPLAPPGYELMRRIGEGGMGVVFQARDTRDGHIVALKTVSDQRVPKMKEVIRFLSEAEVQASIAHENVVRVHKVGESGGRPYMVMEYLNGGTLAEKLKDGRLKPKKAAALVQRIARGVAAAHARGVFHRDLKPANILFNDAGEPKVADFGLAKRDTSDLTLTGALMGTPAYMAPEQASGQNALVGAATDVWGLGVILYECLTGKRPFKADDVHVLLSKISADEPPSILKRAPDVPRDLERICLKCLEKNPKDRYASAAELLDDLEAQAAGRPIGVRRVTWVDRAARFARKRPTAVAIWGLALLAVVLGSFTAIAVNLWQEADAQRADAVSARDLADRAKVEAEILRDQYAVEKAAADRLRGEAELARDAVSRANYFRSLDLGWRAHLDGNGLRARQMLKDLKTDTNHHGWEWDYIARRVNPEVLTFETPPGITEADRYRWLTYTRDDRFVCGLLVRDGDRSNIRRVVVWNAQTGQFLHTIPPLGGPTASEVFISDSGTRVLVKLLPLKPEDVGTLIVHDTATGKELARFAGQLRPMQSVYESRDGNQLLVHSSVRQNEGATDAPVPIPAPPEKKGPADEKLKTERTRGRPAQASNHLQEETEIDPVAGTCDRQPPPPPPLPNGQFDELVLLDLRKPGTIRSYPIEGHGIGVVDFILDEREILAEETLLDRTTRLVCWTAATGERRVLPLEPIPQRVNGIAAVTDRDGRRALVILKNCNAGLFDLAENKLVREYPPARFDVVETKEPPAMPKGSRGAQAQPPANRVPDKSTRVVLGDFIGDGSQIAIVTVRTLYDFGGYPKILNDSPLVLDNQFIITTYDTVTGQVIRTRPIPGYAFTHDYLPTWNGRWWVDIVQATRECPQHRDSIRALDLSSNRVRELPIARETGYIAIDISIDSRQLVAARKDGTIVAMELEHCDHWYAPVPTPGFTLRGYTPDGSRLLVERAFDPPKDWTVLDSDSPRSSIAAYDSHSGRLVWPTSDTPQRAHVAFLRDGTIFLQEAKGDDLVFWPVGGGVTRSIRMTTGVIGDHDHELPIWTSDGRHFVSTRNGLRMWDAETGREVWSRPDVQTSSPVAIPIELQKIRSTPVQKKLNIDTPKGYKEVIYLTSTLVAELILVLIKSTPTVLSPDGAFLAVVPDSVPGSHPVKIAGRVDEIALLDARTGKTIGAIPYDTPPQGVVFSPDSRSLAVLSGERLLLYDVRTRQLLYQIRTPGQGIGLAVFSPDGTRLVTATGSLYGMSATPSEDQRSSDSGIPPGSIATIWDARDGREIFSIPVKAQGTYPTIHDIAFHPRGEQIAFLTSAGLVVHQVR